MLPAHHVIWLDDVDRYVTGGGLTAGLLVRLAARNTIVATLRAREWDRFQPTNQLRPPEWDSLNVFEKVTLDRDRDRPNDEELARAVPDPEIRERIARVGIGEYVGAAQHITDQLALGAQSHLLGYALVRGAVDWHRSGVTRPVPVDLLLALASARLTPRARRALADNDNYADALAWATREINPTVALLEPGEDSFTVYDFALDCLTATHDAPPTPTWQLIISNSEPGELAAIGYQAAVTYNLYHIAEQAWRRSAASGHTGAMSNLGVLLKQRGDLGEAEAWWRSAAGAGNAGAMNNLGVLLKQRGDLDQAEIWERRAAEIGNTGAMYNLGLLLQERGDLDEAETWYRSAAKGGDTGGMNKLGVLLLERGDLDEAETWMRRAAEAGDGCAMSNLGLLMLGREDLDEAETWWRRAAEIGNTGAIYNVSVLLRQRGDHERAENLWHRATVPGHIDSMDNFRLYSCHQFLAVETWWRRDLLSGRTDSMNSLGFLRQERGDLDEFVPVSDERTHAALEHPPAAHPP
jgi:TPR repeat protein